MAVAGCLRHSLQYMGRAKWHAAFGVAAQGTPGLISRVAMVNGQPGLVNYLHGVPYAVVALDSVEGRIQELDLIVNPDKLQHVPSLA